MSDPEVKNLRDRERKDRKLIERAAQALAEIDRAQGLTGEQADVLTSLRIRLEGKERARLEDLIATTEDISGSRDLGDLVSGGEPKPATDWPTIEEKKRDWPG
jgi:flagellar motility protein MotE (MotC chaperone)